MLFFFRFCWINFNSSAYVSDVKKGVLDIELNRQSGNQLQIWIPTGQIQFPFINIPGTYSCNLFVQATFLFVQRFRVSNLDLVWLYGSQIWVKSFGSEIQASMQSED